MATNKRKESAALFELIDKSTLKVPKSGSLKIPSWWSSSKNPPAANPETSKTTSNSTSASGDSTEPAAAVAEAVPLIPDAAVAEAEVPVQPRLFEPPPANVTPSNSPSIRPPVAAVIAAPVGVSSAPVGGASGAAGGSATGGAPSIAAPAPKMAEVKKDVAETSTPKKEAVVAGRSTGAAAPRVFAPQTVAQNRKVWTPPRPGTFARMPLWTLIAGGAGAVALVVLAVMLGKYATRAKPAQTQPVAETRGAVATRSTIGFGSRGGTAAPIVPLAARVHAAGEVGRKLGLYYIVVYTAPTSNTKPEESVAYAHAKFLAEHGVDCSIETVLDRHQQMWYWVVTAQGVDTASAADAQLNQIKKIGDQMKRGVWNGAYASKELASEGTGASRP